MAAKSYRNRWALQVPLYSLITLGIPHIWFFFHFSCFKYPQVVPIHCKMIFCKTGKTASIFIKIWTVAMRLCAYFFICSVICIRITIFFLVSAKLLSAWRVLVFICLFCAGAEIYSQEQRGPVFKTHQGMCNYRWICGTPCQRKLWVLKAYKTPGTVN